MRTVSPDTGHPEITIAEEQEQFLTVVAALVANDKRARSLVGYYPDKREGPSILLRWTFTDEERQAIANGDDLYMMQLTCGAQMTPVAVSVGCPASWIKGGDTPENR